MADESEYNPDNTCMFCNEVNEKFVKQGFEMHYWKSCPMLKQCNDCKQVIEVAVQTEHLLTECQFKNNYKKCTRCTEAVNVTHAAENEFHFKSEKCKILADPKKGKRFAGFLIRKGRTSGKN
jgi:centrosomal protein CEP104